MFVCVCVLVFGDFYVAVLSGFRRTVITLVICCSVNLLIMLIDHNAPAHNSICASEVAMKVICHNHHWLSVIIFYNHCHFNSSSLEFVCCRCSLFVTNQMSVTPVLFVYTVPTLSAYFISSLLHSKLMIDRLFTVYFFFSFSFFLLKKVRREYRKFFRANAGKKIYDFIIQRIVS